MPDAPRLHPCDQCHRLFWPVRGGQRFCSKAHANAYGAQARKAHQAALQAELAALRAQLGLAA